MRHLLHLCTLLVVACGPGTPGSSGAAGSADTRPFPDDPTLWPSIRAERISTLLGPAMARAGAEAWVVFARENANDPLATHIGAENAGGLAAFLFFAMPEGERSSIAISPSSQSTDAEVARFLKRRMAELGVNDGWAPDQNPNVNSGPDRGHSHATDKVIMPGDVIQTDFGIKVHGIWVTDIQRFAYVLREGETAPPPEMQERWELAKAGSRAAFAAMRPGATGWDVDRAQRSMLETNGSISIPWSTGHPVGYWAHDLGPRLGGSNLGQPAYGESARQLVPGQTFAFDGFYGWPLDTGGTKTISVEEMVVITEEGGEWLIAPQEEWVLIGG